MFHYADPNSQQLFNALLFLLVVLFIASLSGRSTVRRESSESDPDGGGFINRLGAAFTNVPLENDLFQLRMDLDAAKELGLSQLPCIVEANSLARQAQSAFDLGQFEDAAALCRAASEQFNQLEQRDRIAVISKSYPALA